MHELLVREANESRFIGHFGVAKTLDVLHEYFYWLKKKRDVQRIYDRCIASRQAKSKILPHDIYSSLLVPKKP